jgi:hypothetical protein
LKTNEKKQKVKPIKDGKLGEGLVRISRHMKVFIERSMDMDNKTMNYVNDSFDY